MRKQSMWKQTNLSFDSNKRSKLTFLLYFRYVLQIYLRELDNGPFFAPISQSNPNFHLKCEWKVNLYTFDVVLLKVENLWQNRNRLSMKACLTDWCQIGKQTKSRTMYSWTEMRYRVNSKQSKAFALKQLESGAPIAGFQGRQFRSQDFRALQSNCWSLHFQFSNFVNKHLWWIWGKHYTL